MSVHQCPDCQCKSQQELIDEAIQDKLAEIEDIKTWKQMLQMDAAKEIYGTVRSLLDCIDEGHAPPNPPESNSPEIIETWKEWLNDTTLHGDYMWTTVSTWIMKGMPTQ